MNPGSSAQGSAESLEQMLDSCEGIVRTLAAKYAPVGHSLGFEYDGLVQEARLGIWTGLASFEPGRGATLSTYCYDRARSAILHALRDRGGMVRLPAYAQEQGCRGPEICCLDDWEITRTGWDPLDAYRLAVRLAVARLPVRQAEAVRLVHLEGLTIRDAAARAGCCYEVVRRRLHNGEERLRALLDWAA